MVASLQALKLNNAFIHVPGSGDNSRRPQPIVMDLARVSTIAGSVTIPPGLSMMARRQYGAILQKERHIQQSPFLNRTSLCDKSILARRHYGNITQENISTQSTPFSNRSSQCDKASSVISHNNSLLNQTRQHQDQEVRTQIQRNNQLLFKSRLQQDHTTMNAVQRNNQLLSQTSFKYQENPMPRNCYSQRSTQGTQRENQIVLRKQIMQRDLSTRKVIQLKRAHSPNINSITHMPAHLPRTMCIKECTPKINSDQVYSLFPLPKRICVRPTRRPENLPNIPNSVLQPSAIIQSNIQRNRVLVVKLPMAVVKR